jgi:DNA polymerase-3 subunit gamma/tau
MNLYQKLRPNTWDEIVGHSVTVKEMKLRSIERNFPQVMLLAGITGSGKTSIARLIAKSITCLNLKPDGNPCNECMFCEDVNNETFAYAVQEYSGSDLDIEGMRELQTKARTPLLTSKYRIFFIDEYQEMYKGGNQKAASNLLKTFETKRKNVYFILGTMDVGAIDKAVENRADVYRINPIDFKDIAKHLHKICVDHSITVDKEKGSVLFAIAQNSSGSLRLAISMLERCINGDIWTLQNAMVELGIISYDSIYLSAKKLLNSDPKFFEQPISEKFVDTLRTAMSMALQKKYGIYIDPSYANLVGDLDKEDEIKLSNTAITLSELRKFPYRDYSLLMQYLTLCFINIKNIDARNTEMKVSLDPKPTRQRVQ